jgi:hypothetical protein
VAPIQAEAALLAIGQTPHGLSFLCECHRRCVHAGLEELLFPHRYYRGLIAASRFRHNERTVLDLGEFRWCKYFS